MSLLLHLAIWLLTVCESVQDFRELFSGIPFHIKQDCIITVFLLDVFLLFEARRMLKNSFMESSSAFVFICIS